MAVKRHFIWISLVGAAAFLLGGGGTAFSEGSRLAVVDIERAVGNSRAGIKAREILGREKKRLETNLVRKRTAIESLVKQIRELQLEIQQKGPILRPEQREKKNATLTGQKRRFTRQQDELKRMVQESRRDLSVRGNRMMGNILIQIREVVNEIGKEGKYDLIIERAEGGVMYMKKAVDITGQVIELYNKKKK
ncbi:MAG: OmpH family outer membrane protein [Nitrospinota bacterium]